MSTRYTKKVFDRLSKQVETDLRQVLSQLSGNTDKEVVDYVAIVTALLDGGGFQSFSSKIDIVNLKYLNVNQFKGVFNDDDRKQQQDRIERVRDYYRWLEKYEVKEAKRKEKDPAAKANSPQEQKTLEEIGKVKKKSESIYLKTPRQAITDFRNAQDAKFKKATYDFQTRWDNNNEKVGNVFSQNYTNLKADLDRYLNQGLSPYLQKYNFYRNIASRYGLEEIAQSTLDCLIKRGPISEFAKELEAVQKDINNFIDTADKVFTETFNIADAVIGIAEEVRDTASYLGNTKERVKKIKNQYKNYKNKLDSQEVPTKRDVERNKLLNQFAKTLLPLITTKVANVLSIIISNQCNEDDIATVGIPSLIDRESYRNNLNNFGYDADTGDEYLAMLQDISGFLTPIEICQLFNGEAPDQVLNSITYFISIYYKRIFIQLSTRAKLSAFFLFIGQFVDQGFCKEIEFSALGDGFCFGEDTYEAQLRECLVEQNPDLLDRLKKSYIETQRKQFRNLLEFSFYPFELKGEQQALNNIFKEIKTNSKEKALSKIAEQYESRYQQSLLTMPLVFIQQKERTEIADVFEENTFAGALNDLDKETRDKIRAQIPARVTRLERFILPSFNQSMFLSKDECGFERPLAGPQNYSRYFMEKKYDLFGYSKRKIRSIISNLIELENSQRGVDRIKIDTNQIFHNPSIRMSNYNENNKIAFETKTGIYSCYQDFDSESHYLYPGDPEVTGPSGINSYIQDAIGKTEGYGSDRIRIQSNTPKIDFSSLYKIREKDVDIKSSKQRGHDPFSSYETYLKTIPLSIGASYGDKYTEYNTGFRETYNKMVNICRNSVFAKKIPVGLAGPSDNGNVSGLEVVRIGQDLDPECSKNLVDNFGMISFKRYVKQISRIDVTNFVKNSLELEEMSIRKKFFNSLMSFKMHVLDFMTKSIFLFSEFDFEKEEVDDTMIDYIYVQYFQKLTNQDLKLNVANIEYESLTKDEKQKFIDKIYSSYEVKPLIDKYQKDLTKIPNEIINKNAQFVSSKQDYENAVKRIEQGFLKFLLDGKFYKFLNNKNGSQFPVRDLKQAIRNTRAYRLGGKFARDAYDGFIDRLDALEAATISVANNLGYETIDLELGKEKDANEIFSDGSLEVVWRREDDVVDVIYAEAQKWNTDWKAWHKTNVRQDPKKLFTNAVNFELAADWIYFKTNLWTGPTNTPVELNVSTGLYQWTAELNKLFRNIRNDLRTYSTELQNAIKEKREVISLENKAVVLEELIESLQEFSDNQENAKYNITYDTAMYLLKYHNENYPKKKTEDFCEAVRNLICFDIADNSKVLKDIIYTPFMKGQRVFNIKDRIVEKELNIFHSNNTSIKDDIEKQTLNILTNVAGGEYPYFQDAKQIDDYIDSDLKQVITDQIGNKGFFLTKVKFDPNKDTSATVEVHRCFKVPFFLGATSATAVKLSEKKYINELYKYGVDPRGIVEFTEEEGTLTEKETGSLLGRKTTTSKDPVSQGVVKLFKAMSGPGTDEDAIFQVLENNNAEVVYKIQQTFSAIYINEEGWGTLEESLKDELSGNDLNRAFRALDQANKAVQQAGGLKVGQFNFVPYPNFNRLDLGVNRLENLFGTSEPFDTDKTVAKGKDAKGNAILIEQKDQLYQGGYRWISNAKYPVSSFSQFFERELFRIGEYKHLGQQTQYAFNKFNAYRDNPKIDAYVRTAARTIVPNYISFIDELKEVYVDYAKAPVITFTVDASNYKDFVQNYKQKKGKDPTLQEYVDHCLKHKIIAEARKQIFSNNKYGDIYSNSFPVYKMLSHIAINMNQYVTFINNVESEEDDVFPRLPKSLRSAEDYSFFNLRNALSLGLSLGTGLASATNISQAKIANSNLSVGDILQLTESFDHTIFFLKSTIKYFLRNVEQFDINIKEAKRISNKVSSAIRRIYKLSRVVDKSSRSMAKLLGGDPPANGIPSMAELDAQFKGMRYLFNLPTSPIAITLFATGGLPPSNFSAWISYIILESTLITIELLEDYGILEELEKLLFGADVDNPIGAPGLNYINACKRARDELLKRNPIKPDGKNLKTSGGEYLLPDGREYVGEYHIHKDGTVMVGGDHPKGQPTIVLVEKAIRDDIDV